MPDAPNSTQETAFGTTASSGPKDAVLLLEDNDVIVRFLTIVLQGLGLRVLTCHNGAEAMSTFARQSGRIALVFADCKLPDADGRVLCHQMQQSQPDLPVLLTSGGELDGLSPLVPGNNVQFMPKPYVPSVIISRVRSLIKQAGAGRPQTAPGFG